jgi:LPXTG-site transpeptidase (sortase) family protein
MLKSFAIVLVSFSPLILPVGAHSMSTLPPAEVFSFPTASLSFAPDLPERLSIPSIGLDAPIQGLGVNEKGEMDVPNGGTNNVGWYASGTVPGQRGSAVLDAHVFAAFSKLKYLKVGSTVDVQTVSGSILHFVVTDSEVYTTESVPVQRLFADKSGELLNLITCAGTLLPDGSTYDHRLVVYARLVPNS